MRPSRRVGRVWEIFREGQEGSGGTGGIGRPSQQAGGVRWSSQRLGGVGMPIQRAGVVWKLEVHFGEPGGVESPFRKARRGPEDRERSGGPLGRAGRGWESLLEIERGRESLPEGRDGLGGLPSGPERVERHSRRAGSGQEALSEDWVG